MAAPALERLATGVRWEDLRLPGSSRAALAGLAARERGATLALFSGPAGTGKTLAAEALAARLELPAFRADLSQVVSQYIGETEKNLARVFEAVGAAAAVLLLDEADALFGKRTGIGDAHDRYADIEIAYLLQRLEAFSGVVILATTRPAALAPLARARSSATVAIPRLLRA
ncbi:MAG: ATP-binding protein [Acidobacteria bacterium]|nr:ATP-binding protein [Acidobacteriota bacterium]